MEKIMKINEITLKDVKDHCNIYHNNDDDYLQNIVIPSSKAYIKVYTGLDDEAIDKKEDLSIAFLVLCADMYDNRQYQVNSVNKNPIVESILNMHSINLL